MSILPERPLPIRKGFLLRYGIGAAICAAGAAVIVFFGGRWVADAAEQIRRDNTLWTTGTPALYETVEGQERSNHFVFYSYDLKVEYQDAQRNLHKADISFDSLWTEVNQSKPPEIRYNPASPEEFALSWAVDLGGARWGSFGVSCFGLLLIVGTLGVLSWAFARQITDWRRCAERSDEVFLEVVSVTPQIVNGTNTGAMIYRYRMPGSLAASSGADGAKDGATGEVVLARGAGPPLYGDEEGKTIVALVSPHSSSRPVVLRRDLYPFDFTPEEAAAIRERLEAQQRWASKKT